MAVIVTGGAGFIGSHLVDTLIEHDRVLVLDNLSTGRLANLERALGSRRATFVYADITCSAGELDLLVREATPEPITAVYHLASPASRAACDERPWETLAANGYGTMQLLELARRYGATFFFASSAHVYGDALTQPQPESYLGNVDPVGPRASFEEGKRFGEAVATTASRTLGVDVRIARIFDCYGPRMSLRDGRLVPALLAAADARRPFAIHGDGAQTRSLTFVSDIVEGILCVARAPIGAAPVNLGSTEERSVLDIARTFARIAHVPFSADFLPARPDDPQRRRPDIDAAARIGWSPKISLEDGLWQTIAWQRFALHTYATG